MWAPFEATLVNLGSKNISSFAVTTRNVCRGITRIFTCTLDAQLDVHDCHVNLKSDTCKTKLVKTKQIGTSKRSSISHLAVVESAGRCFHNYIKRTSKRDFEPWVGVPCSLLHWSQYRSCSAYVINRQAVTISVAKCNVRGCTWT